LSNKIGYLMFYKTMVLLHLVLVNIKNTILR